VKLDGLVWWEGLEGELVTDTMKTAFTMQLLSLSCADVAIPESVV